LIILCCSFFLVGRFSEQYLDIQEIVDSVFGRDFLEDEKRVGLISVLWVAAVG
jgi:hypothetical protein